MDGRLYVALSTCIIYAANALKITQIAFITCAVKLQLQL